VGRDVGRVQRLQSIVDGHHRHALTMQLDDVPPGDPGQATHPHRETVERMVDAADDGDAPGAIEADRAAPREWAGEGHHREAPDHRHAGEHEPGAGDRIVGRVPLEHAERDEQDEQPEQEREQDHAERAAKHVEPSGLAGHDVDPVDREGEREEDRFRARWLRGRIDGDLGAVLGHEGAM
jgi:hypothetical protein